MFDQIHRLHAYSTTYNDGFSVAGAGADVFLWSRSRNQIFKPALAQAIILTQKKTFFVKKKHLKKKYQLFSMVFALKNLILKNYEFAYIFHTCKCVKNEKKMSSHS